MRNKRTINMANKRMARFDRLAVACMYYAMQHKYCLWL